IYAFWVSLTRHKDTEHRASGGLDSTVFSPRLAPVITSQIMFLSGILLGLAMLVRPIAFFLAFPLAFVIWVAGQGLTRGRRIHLILLLLLGNFLAVLPWQGWVYAQTGQVAPLGSGGKLTIRDGLTYLVMEKDYREGVDLSPDVEALVQNIFARRSEMLSMGGVVEVALDEARQAPIPFAKLIGVKLARSWYATDSNRFEGATFWLQLLYLALIGWGSWVAWRRKRPFRPLILTLWLITLYFWFMTVLVVPLLRYMLPVMGLLFVFVPGVILSIRDGLSRLKFHTIYTAKPGRVD
ncbi:MAG: hypothetical protein KAG66_25095, partial [Methylococcales bacterium]|nr:hypothetical protein [Methylococcales bacterium]